MVCHVEERSNGGGTRLLRHRKWTDERGNLYEIVLWRVPPSAAQPEGVRYRLAFIRAGEDTPALLYDNHHPKGHHRHVDSREEPYRFTNVQELVMDFTRETRRLAGETK